MTHQEQDIHFTQFLRPDGRTRPMTVARPAPIAALAAAVRAAGGRFEIEELRDRTVSMTVEHDTDARFEDVPVAIKLCPNGPKVPEMVDALVREAYERLVGPVPIEAQDVPNSYARPPYGYTLDVVDGCYFVSQATDDRGGFSRQSFGIDRLAALERFAEILTTRRCVECRAPVLLNYTEPIKTEMIAQQVCFSCNFWRKRVAEFGPETVIVGGEHYRITPDRPKSYRGFLGFGGSEFRIVFKDGRRAVTHNLWLQGKVPAHFRDRLPDNARFIREEEQHAHA